MRKIHLLIFLAINIYIQAEKNDVQDHQFVIIKGGTYQVGRESAKQNEPRTVYINTFEIATFETTNAQFKKFVDATAYITDAERKGKANTFRLGLPPFTWDKTRGANWRHPNGPGDSIKDKMDHPVTQISYKDAQAYCDWAGLRLPTVEEWEIAASAGKSDRYYWGEDWTKRADYANTWDGDNYSTTTMKDGYMTTAPVGKFKPNEYGLYDTIGNVFEYCADSTPQNSYPPTGPGRGGSWWCARHSCSFHNLSDIGRMHINASFSNQGFRVARDPINNSKKDVIRGISN